MLCDSIQRTPIQLAQQCMKNIILLLIGRRFAQNRILSAFPCSLPNCVAIIFRNRQRIARSWSTFDSKRAPGDFKLRPCLAHDLMQPPHPRASGAATSSGPVVVQLLHCAPKKAASLARIVHCPECARLCLRIQFSQMEPAPAALHLRMSKSCEPSCDRLANATPKPWPGPRAKCRTDRQ